MTDYAELIESLDDTAPKKPKQGWGVKHREIVNEAIQELKTLEKIEKLVDKYNEQFYEDEEKTKHDAEYYLEKIGGLLGW